MPVLEFGATTIGLITRGSLWPEVLWSSVSEELGPGSLLGFLIILTQISGGHC